MTPREQSVVDEAMKRKGSPDDVLAANFNLEIKRMDIQLLKATGWLNDEIINFYGELIMQRSKSRRFLPRVMIMNTFFMQRLCDQHSGYQYQRVRKWTKDVDVFEFEKIIVPVHLGNHWCLAVIDMCEKQIKYYDSLGSSNSACLSALHRWIVDEWENKHGKKPIGERPPKPDMSLWKKLHATDIPAQRNGYDCGVFACKFAECISRGAPFGFSQSDMPSIRRAMVFEIISQKLFL